MLPLLALLPCLLGLAAIPAQTRLLATTDLADRAATAVAVQDLLGARTDLPTTVALAAVLGQRLAPGSGARAQLDAALVAANRSPAAAAERALGSLRMALHDLVETLTFAPLLQAEAPKGFPEFRAVDEIELRQYPRYRMVRTKMRGGTTAAFWPLFRHIEGNHIAMTTPVQMDWQSNDEGPGRPVQMAFLYGDPEREPGQADRGVEVVDVPAQTVLSIGAIGDDRRERVDELLRRLHAAVAEHPNRLSVAGAVRTMNYNSPMVPRERRYFEVQLPVQCQAVAECQAK
ncbi:MAG: heme-binding protein [Planctomycetes bacterium]|nr:heme-binding protein [Planctomycetota bacterium]